MLSTKNNSNKKDRRNAIGSSISEFGGAFVAFFFVILIPCINVASYGFSYGLANTTTNKLADEISKANSRKRTVEIIETTENKMTKDGLFHIFRLKTQKEPIKLELAVEDLKGVEKRLPFESTKSIKIDRSKNFYRYCLTTTFQAKPIVDLSGIPVLGQVPIIAAATPIRHVVYTDIEHPEFLIFSKKNQLN